jgi:hypothetical protein
LRKYVKKYGMKSVSNTAKNNDVVDIPVDKLSVNKALITNTYTSASQFLKKQNSFQNRNAKAEADKNAPLLNRSKTKKSEESKLKEEKKNPDEIKIKIEPRGSKASNHLKIPDNISIHSSMGENNTEHNHLLPVTNKPLDYLNISPNLLKVKDNNLKE